MKTPLLLVSLAAALLHIGPSPVSAGRNDANPGTSGVHYPYNCAGDPMGCQNMCYYYYCLGRTNYVTYVGNNAAGNKAQKDHRSESGYRHKIFSAARRAKLGTQVLSPAYTTPDEYPPASAKEGGTGASLIGHDKAYLTQGARMKRMFGYLGNRQGWIEPYNWNPTLSPACNCKPNWPEHTYWNYYGSLCDCGKDKVKRYIYRMTQDARKYSDAKFENWDPTPGWSSARWNFQGYSKKRSTGSGGEEPEEEDHGEVVGCGEVDDDGYGEEDVEHCGGKEGYEDEPDHEEDEDESEEAEI